jgi:hypothetical protein
LDVTDRKPPREWKHFFRYTGVMLMLWSGLAWIVTLFGFSAAAAIGPALGWVLLALVQTIRRKPMWKQREEPILGPNRRSPRQDLEHEE